MIRAALGIAVVTALCIMSPERESSKSTAESNRPSALSAATESLASRGNLAALAIGAAGQIDRVTLGAMTQAVERPAADTIRRIVIPPTGSPVETTPLRR